MDQQSELRIRPLPVGTGLAVLEGAARTATHLLWGVPVALLLAMALGGSAMVVPDADGGHLDILARAMLGPVLAVPPVLGLLALMLSVLVVARRRRLVGRYADEFRPLAIERHHLAASAEGRLRIIALVAGWIAFGLMILFGAVAMMGGPAEFWHPPLGAAAIAALLLLTARLLKAPKERADRQWNEYRMRWPRTGTRPSAYSLAEDDEPGSKLHVLFGIGVVALLGSFATFAWGVWQAEDGELGLAGTGLTPFHLSIVLLPIGLLCAVAEAVLFVGHRLRQYRHVEQDPQLSAEMRVDAGHAPTAGTAAAREMLRRHPLRLPAIVCAGVGGTLLTVSGTLVFGPMTGEDYEGSAGQLLWLCALPGMVLTITAWGLFAHAARALPRHRLRVLGAYPGIDPVVARVKKSDSDGTTRHDVVYGDRAGDPELLEKYADDDPR